MWEVHVPQEKDANKMDKYITHLRGLSNKSHRLSPINIQRHIVLDEETPAEVMAKSWQEAEKWEKSEDDAVKHHKEALDQLIQAATEAVEFAKANNLSRQEIMDTENGPIYSCPSQEQFVRGTAVFHVSESFHDDPKGCEVDWKFLHPVWPYSPI